MSAHFEALNRRARETLRGLLWSERPVVPRVPAGDLPSTKRKQRAVVTPAARPARRLAPGEMRSYDGLREKLLIAANGKPLRMLVFAGCGGGEGCTQVVREFAETLASSGLNVLLLDADLRTSGLTSSLALEGADLTEVVGTGASSPATSWGKGQLTVVPSRVSLLDKERFLRAAGFAAWLDAQRSHYDYVLLDAPPLLRFADGTLIGRLCDGVVIVVQAEETKRESLVRVREQLEHADVHIAGVVLNRVRNPVPVLLRPYLTVE